MSEEGIARYKARVVASAEKDMTKDDGGYVVFWPTANKGCYSAWDLRIIANELDRRNKDWDDYVNSYFTESPDGLRMSDVYPEEGWE